MWRLPFNLWFVTCASQSLLGSRGKRPYVRTQKTWVLTLVSALPNPAVPMGTIARVIVCLSHQIHHSPLLKILQELPSGPWIKPNILNWLGLEGPAWLACLPLCPTLCHTPDCFYASAALALFTPQHRQRSGTQGSATSGILALLSTESGIFMVAAPDAVLKGIFEKWNLRRETIW